MANHSVALWQWFGNEVMETVSTETLRDIYVLFVLFILYACDICVTPWWNSASTESQQFLVMHLWVTKGRAWIYELIPELSIVFIGQNTKYRYRNTDSKMIDIANCKTCKKTLLAVEYKIVIRYYYEPAKMRALYQSRDGPAGRPADTPPRPDRLRDFHGTIPELTVRVCWQPGRPIWQLLSFDPDLYLKC